MRAAAGLLLWAARFSIYGPISIPDHQLWLQNLQHESFAAARGTSPAGIFMKTSVTRRSFLAAGIAAPTALASQWVPGFAAEDPAKFKLGIVTYNVPKDWDLPTLLKVCREVGITAIECRTTHKHGVEPTLTADERRAVKKQFADSGVVFWGCGSVCEFHSDDPKVVQKNVEDCKEFVKLVHDLGGRGVKVRPNGVPKGADEQKTFEQIGRALKECGAAAADAGIEICVEVHGPTTQIPKNMKTIMEACGHKAVGVTWNSNATDVENGSVAHSFDLLKPWIRSCHINDLENDAKGKYPYRELFKLLRGISYDRFTMCEVGTAYGVEEGTKFLKGYKSLWEKLVKG
jgi:sugar phosphate isomerase/epimerase